MSTLKIIKGPRIVPIRATIYGVEGIGKSTLGSLLPKPLFLDVEGSTNQLDVERVEISTWAQLGSTFSNLAIDPQGYKSIVVDTADWAERLCLEELLRKHGKKSIEDFGFGKGYTHLAEEFSRTLALCDGLISKGLHVVWIAHSKVVRQSPPDQTDGFDRYELKLSKQISPLLKEWSDILLFCKFKLQIVEGTDGRIKAQGGKERVIHTTNSAAWDAKNRFGLPEIIPLATTLPPEIAAVFAGNVARKIETSPVKTKPATPEKPVAPITAEQLSKLQLYTQNSCSGPVIEKALAHYGETLDLLTEEQAAKVILRCQEELNRDTEKPKAAAPEKPASGVLFPWPKDIAAWLSGSESAVNAYLVSVKWIQVGQTFRDLHGDRAEKIITKPDAFARAANITPFVKAA